MRDLFDQANKVDGAPASAKRARGHFRIGGMAPRELILVSAAIATFIWGAWVTNRVVDSGDSQHEFVQLQLQGIIGEYLQAQARSNADERTAARETSIFMTTLDQSVAALSEEGKVILVNEAIIGGSIPDVTERVKAAVYAQVPRPQPAVSPQANAVQAEMEQWMEANGGGQDHAQR